MNSYDEQIVARDRALPGLRSVLDPNAFVAMLRASHFPLAVSGAMMTYIRYKPGQSCLVGYELATEAGVEQVYTKVYRADERDKLAKASERFSGEGKSEGGGFVDEARFLLTSRFPHDAKLRALRRLKTSDDRFNLLCELFGNKSAFTAGQIEPIRYKPERRYVGRLDVDGAPVAVLKFYTDSAFEGIRARSTAFQNAGPLRLTPLVGHTDHYRALAFEWLFGDRLTESLVAGTADPRVLEQVGLSLALMHGQPGVGLPMRTADDERRHLAGIAESLAFLLPRQAAYIGGIVRRIQEGLIHLPRVVRPTHGDFYAKQVLIQGDEIQLLDFDESALDNPLVDVGNFIAHLQRDRMRNDLAADAMQGYDEAFLEGYTRQAGRVAPRDIALSVAAALLKLAPHPFRFREADWPERMLQILACVDDYATRGARAGRLAAAPKPHAAIDPGMPHLEEALDTASATRALRVLPGAGAIQVERARLVRHKAGRRALIAYDIRLTPDAPETVGWLGKMRAKGLDRTTYERTRALWENGFGRSNDAGVSVAEPVGMVPEWRLWLQKKEAGVSAAERLADPDGAGVARRIAAALVRLHALGPEADRFHGVADELRILDERLTLLMNQRPDWAMRLGAVLAACRQQAAALPTPPPRPIHRDFYADNVLIDGDHTVLLDLDLSTMGDPALDAGNFIAHLVEQGLRDADDAGRYESRASAFQEAFLVGSAGARCKSVELYTTLALVRHIHISTLFPERRRYTHTLLDLCEARLGVARAAGIPPLVATPQS